MPEVRIKGLFQKILPIGLFLHFLIGLVPFSNEVRLVLRDLPLLWGKSNEERRIDMLGGVLDSVEDHGFIAECEREIPADAEVLIVSNSMANVYMLNYYLYPRKTAVDREALGESYWTVHHYSPKTRGMNSITGPQENGAPD